MMGTIKLITSAMARNGINYVRGIVESSNSIFHEVHQENDYGNDAFVELVDGVDVKGITIAIQVKSGKSFCTKNTCKIPASKQHFEYWKSHSLPVLGIVYDPDEKKAYWVDIKSYIKNKPGIIEGGPYTINFKKTEFASFTLDGFEKILKPMHLNKQIKLPLEQARRFITSTDFTEHSLGLHVLVKHYFNNPKAWNYVFKTFRERDVLELDSTVIYYLAHIPGHSDIFLTQDQTFTSELKGKLRSVIEDFSERDVAKILCLFEEEDSFERGSLGQSAEAVISLVKDKEDKLYSIITSSHLPIYARNAAVILHAYYSQGSGIGVLKNLAVDYPDLYMIKEMVEHLEHEGYLYLY
ncbi:DUF4365 domain-containing protein [Serratia fonticola]|uniref:DUF4365 domain-containing protein n=1 Tax=Serratia fonticola TaxID=47917 RepID=UPI0021B76A67|nr:DUF4365 domain-containing protein [Serratia fonticola]